MTGRDRRRPGERVRVDPTLLRGWPRRQATALRTWLVTHRAAGRRAVFVMPGPYERKDRTDSALQELADHLRP